MAAADSVLEGNLVLERLGKILTMMEVPVCAFFFFGSDGQRIDRTTESEVISHDGSLMARSKKPFEIN